MCALFVSLFTYSFGFARLFAALVASSATSGAPQHAFRSLISQLTFSFLVARRVRDPRLFAVHRHRRLGRSTKHPRACFGAHLATYSIPLTVHSFSNKNTRSPPSLRHHTPSVPLSTHANLLNARYIEEQLTALHRTTSVGHEPCLSLRNRCIGFAHLICQFSTSASSP